MQFAETEWGMALRTNNYCLANLIWEMEWRGGIEVRFKALILWEGLSLHDTVQSLIIRVFLTGFEWLNFFYHTGKFSLFNLILALLLDAFENSPWMIFLVDFQILTYIKCQEEFDLFLLEPIFKTKNNRWKAQLFWWQLVLTKNYRWPLPPLLRLLEVRRVDKDKFNCPCNQALPTTWK